MLNVLAQVSQPWIQGGSVVLGAFIALSGVYVAQRKTDQREERHRREERARTRRNVLQDNYGQFVSGWLEYAAAIVQRRADVRALRTVAMTNPDSEQVKGAQETARARANEIYAEERAAIAKMAGALARLWLCERNTVRLETLDELFKDTVKLTMSSSDHQIDPVRERLNAVVRQYGSQLQQEYEAEVAASGAVPRA